MFVRGRIKEICKKLNFVKEEPSDLNPQDRWWFLTADDFKVSIHSRYLIVSLYRCIGVNSCSVPLNYFEKRYIKKCFINSLLK